MTLYESQRYEVPVDSHSINDFDFTGGPQQNDCYNLAIDAGHTEVNNVSHVSHPLPHYSARHIATQSPQDAQRIRDPRGSNNVAMIGDYAELDMGEFFTELLPSFEHDDESTGLACSPHSLPNGSGSFNTSTQALDDSSWQNPNTPILEHNYSDPTSCTTEWPAQEDLSVKSYDNSLIINSLYAPTYSVPGDTQANFRQSHPNFNFENLQDDSFFALNTIKGSGHDFENKSDQCDIVNPPSPIETHISPSDINPIDTTISSGLLIARDVPCSPLPFEMFAQASPPRHDASGIILSRGQDLVHDSEWEYNSQDSGSLQAPPFQSYPPHATVTVGPNLPSPSYYSYQTTLASTDSVGYSPNSMVSRSAVSRGISSQTPFVSGLQRPSMMMPPREIPAPQPQSRSYANSNLYSDYKNTNYRGQPIACDYTYPDVRHESEEREIQWLSLLESQSLGSPSYIKPYAGAFLGEPNLSTQTLSSQAYSHAGEQTYRGATTSPNSHRYFCQTNTSICDAPKDLHLHSPHSLASRPLPAAATWQLESPRNRNSSDSNLDNSSQPPHHSGNRPLPRSPEPRSNIASETVEPANFQLPFSLLPPIQSVSQPSLATKTSLSQSLTSYTLPYSVNTSSIPIRSGVLTEKSKPAKRSREESSLSDYDVVVINRGEFKSQCGICIESILPDRRAYNEHLQKHHPALNIQCPRCPKIRPTSSMAHHWLSHLPLKLKCPSCSREYPSLRVDSFKRHLTTVCTDPTPGQRKAICISSAEDLTKDVNISGTRPLKRRRTKM